MLNHKKYVLFIIVLVLLCAFGYAQSLMPLANKSMKVQLLWQDESLNCQSTFTAGQENNTWFIEQFQFFISDIQFGSDSSGWQPAKLSKTAFQTGGTALLGTNCSTAQKDITSTNQGNWKIEFAADMVMNERNRIRFTLGVPFESNHLNPISQQSPLNLSSMFWVWQTGHKFLRLELAGNNKQWLFHLGSTGCHSASVMRAPKKACRYPNRFDFDIPIANNDDGQLILNVDLAALLQDVSLTTTSNCQSEADSVNCQQLFSNLSLHNESNSAEIFVVTTAKYINKGADVEVE
ncbi:metallo-mystery pair system four-Cys motif protein [Colwellia sp. Arc7-635]|uniref:MbnP family copper-binding protein n=1 Tax=Colwellia sp. Arc7-635 TaxID=2497879 RepID=UPI000F85684B|nr:MbnP family copper-binding protein [Colwellia sp. Arc7-635]AZQ83270.1 metallo-mystery pair system four-Cys motif protein [Colwellia sp. Arc7-635]